MKKSVVGFCFAILLAAMTLYAAAPATNVSGLKHPNLARAQSFVDLAYQKVIAAQKANEYDLGGHADKAKSMLESAANELKQAAVAADGDNGANVVHPEDLPDKNVNATKHPNLAQAQSLINTAYASVVSAQRANEYDLGGHAEKAKTLLEQASNELKLAAQEATKK